MTNSEFLEQFGHFLEAPNGIQKLRELILQLAVQGRLVSQDSNDLPASASLTQVDSEARTGGKKIRSKTAPNAHHGAFFELPNGWTWARLGQIVDVLDSLRKPVKKQDRKPGPYPYYGASGVVDYVSDYLFDEPLVLVGEDGARWGSGENTAFLISGKTWVNNHAHVLRPIRTVLADEYLVYALVAADLHPFITGMTVPKLNQARLVSVALPLPPLAEQHRIVAKVDELMALCDRLEAERNARKETHQRLIRAVHHPLTEAADAAAPQTAWRRIRDNFSELYTSPESTQELRQTILQLAMNGKLGSQVPGDEEITGFLARIAKEKARRLRDGNLRAQNWKAPAIDTGNLPPIPSSWRWTYIQDIVCTVTVGHVGSMATRYKGSGIPFLRSQNVRPNRFEPTGLTYIDQEFHSELKKSQISPGDVVVVRSGNVGVACAIPEYLKEANCADLVIIKKPIGIEPRLLCFYLNSVRNSRIQEGKVGIALSHFNTKSVAFLAIPVPPPEEQHRIVAKVDELMALCDHLEASIRAKDETAARYAEAVVQQIAAA